MPSTEGIETAVLAEFGSWEEFVAQHLKLFDQLIERQRIWEMSLLLVESQTLPTQTDLLTRYQTTLDNDLYKSPQGPARGPVLASGWGRAGGERGTCSRG